MQFHFSRPPMCTTYVTCFPSLPSPSIPFAFCPLNAGREPTCGRHEKRRLSRRSPLPLSAPSTISLILRTKTSHACHRDLGITHQQMQSQFSSSSSDDVDWGPSSSFVSCSGLVRSLARSLVVRWARRRRRSVMRCSYACVPLPPSPPLPSPSAVPR